MTSKLPWSTPELNQSQSDFQSVAAALVCDAPIFIGLYDASLRVTFLNAVARKMIGLSATASVTSYSITDLLSASDCSAAMDDVAGAVLSDEPWKGEMNVRHLTRPSDRIDVSCSIFPLRGSSGARIGAAVIGIDISARRPAERELRDEYVLVSSVLESLPLGVGIYSRRGALIHSNQRMRAYIGRSDLSEGESMPAQSWHGDKSETRPILLTQYADAASALRHLSGSGTDVLQGDARTARWMRISAMPLRLESDEVEGAAVLVQDAEEWRQATQQTVAAGTELSSQGRFLEATLSSIPGFVYVFDRQRRFVYANAAMLALFGLSADQMLGRTFAELDYPRNLADRLNAHIDAVFSDGRTVEDEVFFRSPTGYSAYFSLLWGPVRMTAGTIDFVVGVSHDTTERRAHEAASERSEARLRAATELVGLGVYSWDPVTGALDWDERVHAMWGLPPDAPVDMEVYEAGIHPDDLARVRGAIAACVDPTGDGRYSIEYRVLGRSDGTLRQIATSGRTTFEDGQAVGFIGAVIDLTSQRRAEAAIRASEAQFRSFAEHSSNLIWISDPAKGIIVYRSAAFEKIWGVATEDGPVALADWMTAVHPDDRQQVESALATVQSGEVAQYEYRIIRPVDGAIRWLRDTSFPIRDEFGVVVQIGGIAEDLSPKDNRQVYIVSSRASQARGLVTSARSAGYRTRTFHSASAFLDVAPVLAAGCVLADLRGSRLQGLSIPRELKARSILLPAILIDGPYADVGSAVAGMKAGAIDYLSVVDEESFSSDLAKALAECRGAARPAAREERAASQIARLTSRERDVLQHLVEGGTNKTIGKALGISPRTVELHRAQVVSRLGASSLMELLQIALAAGIKPATGARHKIRQQSQEI